MGENKKPNQGPSPSCLKDLWVVGISLVMLLLAAWEESGNVGLGVC